MLKDPKPPFSLSALPDNILALTLIFGIGSVFGLLLYGSFEMNKAKLSEPKKPIQKIDDYFGNKFIKIKYPQKNTAVDNPVQIVGKANVFEANVRVKMKDEMQNVLLDTFITAEGAYDGLYPFEQSVDYTTPSSKYMVMEVFEESPRDGSEINKVIIPLVYKDFIDISNWKDHINSEYGYEIKYPEDWELSFGAGDIKYILNEINVFQRSADTTEESPKFQVSIIDKSDFDKLGNEEELPQANSNLNSYPAFSVSYDSSNGPESYYLEKGDILVIINMTYGENVQNKKESKKIASRILSTFKFIEK